MPKNTEASTPAATEWRTNDLALAAFLLLRGHAPLRVEAPLPADYRVTLAFRDDASLRTSCDDWRSPSCELLVSFATALDTIHALVKGARRAGGAR